MDFETFLKFSQNFGIFPSHVSKYKIHECFVYIAEKEYIEFCEKNKEFKPSSKSNSITNKSNNAFKYISIDNFVDLIALISMEIDLCKSKQFNPLNCLLFIVDKIAESNGIEKIISKTSNMSIFKNIDCSTLLINFRENFISKNLKNEKHEKISSVDDFLNIIS